MWVEETIAFEQNDFHRRIADGWDVMGARTWVKIQEGHQQFGSGLWVLVEAITDAVVFYHEKFLPTLILDHNRLRTLQLDFQTLFYQVACQQTLKKILESLGFTGEILPRSSADLFLKVAVLISDPGLLYDYRQRRNDVAAEVVRAAYAACGHRKLPLSDDLELANDCLRRCCDPKDHLFGDLQNSLAMKLKGRIHDEMRAIKHLTPVQLMRCLIPQKPGFAIESETEGLIHIAKRISHIAEIHWRIWGPILYERPMHVGGRAMSHTSLNGERLNDRRSSLSRRINDSGWFPRNSGLGQ